MKQPPAPLTWQPLVTLEEVRRQRAERHRQLDRAFQAGASPEAVTAAFHAAARADEYEAAIMADCPSWDTVYPGTRRNAR
ncbi:MAG TPA: hypothetical protein VKT82_15435 [Ktedonobacterales bacterium]|nr:hypothetical protein [Ktedonobacterales bacterium]